MRGPVVSVVQCFGNGNCRRSCGCTCGVVQRAGTCSCRHSNGSGIGNGRGGGHGAQV